MPVMKNTFDLSRFGRVLRYTWSTQPVLPYVVLVAAIPLLFLYLLRSASREYSHVFNDDPVLAFVCFFFASGWLYAGLSFREFGRFGSASRYLQLPASLPEKWLAKVLLAFGAFPLITWSAFYLAFQGLGVLLPRLVVFRFAPIDWQAILPTTLFFFYLTLPAAFVSGIVWKRFGFLKGLILFFIVFVVLYFTAIDGVQRFAYTQAQTALFDELLFPYDRTDCSPATCAHIRLFWVLAAYIPASLCLVATYFLMKEKEV